LIGEKKLRIKFSQLRTKAKGCFTKYGLFTYVRAMPTAATIVLSKSATRKAFRLALTLSTALFALSSLAAVGLYLVARVSSVAAVRNELEQLAELAAVQLNGNSHHRIRSNELYGSALHVQTLAPLVTFHKATHDALFVYTVILQENKPYFVLCTDYGFRRPGDTSEIYEIMRPYVGNDVDLTAALTLHQTQSNAEFQIESEGALLSAYAPFYSDAGFEGVVGVDLDVVALEARLARLKFWLFLVCGVNLLVAASIGSIVRKSRLRALQNAELHTELERSRDVAERSSNIASLAAVVAHEFSQHLTVASGHIDLSLMLNGPARATELEFAQDALARAGEGIDQMRALGGSAWTTTRSHRLDGLIQHAVERLERRGLGLARFDVASLGMSRYVQVDALRVEAAIGHLLRNAVQAVDTGKISVVMVNASELSDWTDVFPCAVAQHCVAVVISDTGPGLTPAILASLGKPFFSTHGAGRGLGLTVVKSVVASCGGGLKFQRTPYGSRFALLLPPSAQDSLGAGLHK
jgi:signal transduction histidine kinase